MADSLVEAEVAPAATEEVTTPTESAAGEQQEPQEGTDSPKSVQKRIDKAIRAQREAEREAEFWRSKALTPAPAETRTEAPKTDGEPSENDFETHAEYVKALTKYAVKQASEELTAKQRIEAAKAHEQTAVQQFNARKDAFRAATPDFDEVLADAEVSVSAAVISEILESEHGPELQYYLAKNEDEAKRLSALSPLALAREVGKIESRFTSSQEKTPVKTTGAPPPPTPTSKSTATSTKDPGEMSPSEYRQWRAKQNA